MAKDGESVAADVDRQLAAAGLEKRRTGGTPTGRETAAIGRIERARDAEASDRAYAAIPAARWREWSGCHDRALKKLASIFKLPIGGRTIDLSVFVPAFHAFIDVHRFSLMAPSEKPVGKRPRLGARTKMSNRDVLALLSEAIEVGLSYTIACDHAGVSISSFHTWVRAGEDAMRQVSNGQKLSKREQEALQFLDTLKKARAKFTITRMRRLGTAGANGAWQADCRALEARVPEMFPRFGQPAGHEIADEPDTMWDEAAILMAIMEGTMRGIDAPPGVLPSAWKTHFWTPAQMGLLDSDARFNLVACGRGSGKTEMGLRRLVKLLGRRRDWERPEFFYAAPTNAQAMRIAWDRLGSLIPPAWLRHARKAAQYYETIFGSRVYVIGMDKPARFDGPQYDGGVLDEMSDQQPQAFKLNVYPALPHRVGWCWRTGVPKRVGVGAKQYRLDCEAATAGGVEDTRAHAWPSADILPQEIVSSARALLDPKDFREQFEASWETAGGGIFWAFSSSENIRPCAYHPEARLAITCDFNVNPMAWAVGHRYRGRMEWIDVVFEKDTNTRACLDILWSRYSSHTGGFEFFGDASSRSRKTSADFTDYAHIWNDRRFWPDKAEPRVYVPHDNPPVAERFAACNAMFLSADGERRMFVDPNCTDLIDDLTARHYKPGTMDVQDTGDLGHLTDAMGYLVWRCYPIEIVIGQEAPTVIITDAHGKAR
jgi:hypothetical protein